MKQYDNILIKDIDLAQAIIDAGYFNKLLYKGLGKHNSGVPQWRFENCQEIWSIIKRYHEETKKEWAETPIQYPGHMQFIEILGSDYAERLIREFGLIKRFVFAVKSKDFDDKLICKFQRSPDVMKAWNQIYYEGGADNEEI
ncbi:hypothetical protein [Sinanaerobacter chloroacetimidivorans]|uniref:Uncharacterized protein n=1 Tax=Sinanaerobacter chloroacetimidivorans TaxID=2818044 RepID=A0A8J8B466_9FIRM|nr:hypothetical protein [Sinanaerobacter chloroacetimidivorans]MBR0599035.1 hypothetical protein [Sinanaerobacter chloroacetimidivorans]